MDPNSREGLDIIIDFDGTVVAHEYPMIGRDVGAVPVLKELVAAGHRLILFTMRSNSRQSADAFGTFLGLDEAVNWFKEQEIPLYGIQTNPMQVAWTSSPKAYGQLIIDDTGLGTPLKYDIDVSDRPFVDWTVVRRLLVEMNVLEDGE